MPAHLSGTFNDNKDSAVTFQPLMLATFGPFPDGSYYRLSSHPLTGVAQYAGYDWDPRLNQQEAATLASRSESGAGLLPSYSLTIADSDAFVLLNYQNFPGRGFKGTVLAVDLIMWEPGTSNFTSDSVRKFTGVCDQPERRRTAGDKLDASLFVTASALKNPQRVVPGVRIQKRCPWRFPATAQERALAADNRSFFFLYACGYSPDIASGNAAGNLNGGVPYTSCGKTKSECVARGMYSKDSGNRPTGRFAGIQWNSPQQFRSKSFLQGKTVIGFNDPNESRYGQMIPELYGTGWVDCRVQQPLGDGNSDRFEVIFCLGEISTSSLQRVVVNDVLVQKDYGPDPLFSWYFWTGYPGSRTGLANGDKLFDSNGDPYGSIAGFGVRLPSAFVQGGATAKVRALGTGPKIPIPNSTDTSAAGVNAWPSDYSTSPAWILLDVLIHSGWQYAEIDIATFMTVANYCAAPVSFARPDGFTGVHERFKACLVKEELRAASDTITGLLNSFNGELRRGPSGLLQLWQLGTMADQQPSLASVPGTNWFAGVASGTASGTPATGYAAYHFDENTIDEGTLQLVPRTGAGNQITFEFQNEENQYIQDSITVTDAAAVALSGNQPVAETFPVLGIVNYDQAGRIIETHLGESLRGNQRGDAGGTDRWRWRTGPNAAHLNKSAICLLSFAMDGLSLQPVRIEEIKYEENAGKIWITAAFHSDGWYEDTYGQTSNPFYSTPGVIPSRPPYPLKTRVALPLSAPSDALGHNAWNFGVMPDYQMLADGILALLKIQIIPPPNSPSRLTQPPMVPLQATTLNSGGTIPAGDYVLALSAYDANGDQTMLSRLVTVSVPSAGSITIPNVKWAAGTAGFSVFIGPSELALSRNATASGAGTPASITLTSLGAVRQEGPPDVKFKRARIQVKRTIHTGTWGAAISAFPSATEIQIAGSNWTADQWAGYPLSLLATAAAGAVPEFNIRIVSNTADTLTVDRDVTTLPYLNTGDIVTCRAMARTGSANTIGDSNFANNTPASSPVTSGLTPDAEINNQVWIIAGTGAGQSPRSVVSNSADTLAVSPSWDIVPDSTSVFIITERNWPYDTDTSDYSTSQPDYSAVHPADASIPVDNFSGQALLVRVLTADAADQFFETGAPIREVWIAGRPDTRGSGGGLSGPVAVSYE